MLPKTAFTCRRGRKAWWLWGRHRTLNHASRSSKSRPPKFRAIYRCPQTMNTRNTRVSAFLYKGGGKTRAQSLSDSYHNEILARQLELREGLEQILRVQPSVRASRFDWRQKQSGNLSAAPTTPTAITWGHNCLISREYATFLSSQVTPHCRRLEPRGTSNMDWDRTPTTRFNLGQWSALLVSSQTRMVWGPKQPVMRIHNQKGNHEGHGQHSWERKISSNVPWGSYISNRRW